MLIVNGIFKNNTFVPDHEVPIPDGTRAIISVEGISQNPDETARKKKAWHDFFDGIRTLDEELPLEFDKIIKRGIRFSDVDFS